MKLVIDEPESNALVSYLQAPDRNNGPVVASWLLHTELHCAASRHPAEIDAESVAILLDAVSLVDLTRGDLMTAGTLPGRLRSHDALHLAVALRIGADEMISYDGELGSAATAAGLTTVAPRPEAS